MKDLSAKILRDSIQTNVKIEQPISANAIVPNT